MHRINQKTKNKLGYLLNILVIILILFSNRSNLMVYGASNNWIEVSKTPVGIQYLNRDSINNQDNGIIELKTKYSELDSNTSKEIEENIYVMRINCLTKEFKDISVNGKKMLAAKWEGPNGDKLLEDVILDSCKNV